MRILIAIAAVVAAFSVPAGARADAGRVGITFDPFTGLDGTVGRWVTDNNFSGFATVTHHQGGIDESRLEQVFTSRDIGPPSAEGPPFPGFGTSITQTPTGYPIQASAGLDGFTLQASWARSDIHQDFALGGVSWSRSFMLDPHASLTFSAATTFVHPSNEVPKLGYSDYEYPPPLSTMVEEWRVRLEGYHVFGNGIDMGLSVMNVDPNGPQDVLLGRTAADSHFSYAYDSFGRLSMTLHNDSAQVLFGTFFAAVSAATPLVPEPATWALLLAGLAFILATPRGARTARTNDG